MSKSLGIRKIREHELPEDFSRKISSKSFKSLLATNYSCKLDFLEAGIGVAEIQMKFNSDVIIAKDCQEILVNWIMSFTDEAVIEACHKRSEEYRMNNVQQDETELADNVIINTSQQRRYYSAIVCKHLEANLKKFPPTSNSSMRFYTPPLQRMCKIIRLACTDTAAGQLLKYLAKLLRTNTEDWSKNRSSGYQGSLVYALVCSRTSACVFGHTKKLLLALTSSIQYSWKLRHNNEVNKKPRDVIHESSLLDGLTDILLSIVQVFVFAHELRPLIRDAIFCLPYFYQQYLLHKMDSGISSQVCHIFIDEYCIMPATDKALQAKTYLEHSSSATCFRMRTWAIFTMYFAHYMAPLIDTDKRKLNKQLREKMVKNRMKDLQKTVEKYKEFYLSPNSKIESPSKRRRKQPSMSPTVLNNVEYDKYFEETVDAEEINEMDEIIDALEKKNTEEYEDDAETVSQEVESMSEEEEFQTEESSCDQSLHTEIIENFNVIAEHLVGMK